MRLSVGLTDVNGLDIQLGDTIRFLKSPSKNDMSGIWEAKVIFEDGVVTIDYNSAEQIENPEGWEYKHDYIKSRGWGITVGYPEFGSWNVYRTSLTEIQKGFGHSQEHFKKYFEPIAEKYGWDKRYINVEVVRREDSGY